MFVFHEIPDGKMEAVAEIITKKGTTLNSG